MSFQSAPASAPAGDTKSVPPVSECPPQSSSPSVP
ncbi:unnamed protein product, partial [Staurois parvus]